MEVWRWPQVVLSKDSFNDQHGQLDKHSPKSIWLDERIIPAYVVAASLLILAIQGIVHSKPAQKLLKNTSDSEQDARKVQLQGTWLSKRGGPVIVAFKSTRLAIIIGLFVLILVSALQNHWSWPTCAVVSSLGYAIILGILNVCALAATAQIFSFHLSFVTLGIFAVYAYRDIWPLMTYTIIPADGSEGQVLWIKVILITLAAIVLPAFEPYPYIPVNVADPFPVANPEQTTSLFNFLLYNFLDPLIYKASRTEHLGFDELPPLADYDAAKNLLQRSYPHLDTFLGAPKRNLFWGFVIIFRRSLFYQTLCLLLLGLSVIAAPIGTNRLLTYLENGGEGAIVKPWVWILIIALSPIAFSILFQLYIFLSTGTLARVEAIITSLVFDHALRIRLKAEAGDNSNKSAESSAVNSTSGSPKNPKTPELASVNEDDDNETIHSRSATGATVASSSTATIAAPDPSQSKKVDNKKVQPALPAPTAQKKTNNLIGKINNLVTSDLDNITRGRDFLFLFLSAPLHIALGMWFLYVVLGWSSFVGLAVMITLCPVPAWVASLTSGVQKQKMQATDSRVQNVTEMMSVLRMIKLFGWETRVKETIAEKREEELTWIWKRKLLWVINDCANYTIPLVHMIVTYAVFTIVQKQTLSASIVFSSMTAFNMIRSQMFRVFGMAPWLISAHVSLGRVADFLYNTELLDAYTEEPTDGVVVDSSAAHLTDIGFGKSTYSWSSAASDGASTPSKQPFRLHIDNELLFKKGAFNLIIGPTGSGKTSMLMALLGEMHYIPSGPESWKNLPREGGVAYAAQESWVQNDTIKENIIFGAPYDEQRYKKVIYQCALTRDLSLFEAGDATEVGEKGLTLSGGQKARITLARAVYSEAEIVLLDDILAALDVHTSRWIVDKCFKGELLRGRTVLLVTHNVAMAGPLADFVVSLNTDGHIVSQGSVKDTLAQDAAWAEEVKHEQEAIELEEAEESHADKPVDGGKGQLVVAEEIAVGRISWSAFKLFIHGLGGHFAVLFWFNYLTGEGLSDIFEVLEVWWLGYWAQQYLYTDPSKVPVAFYLVIYFLIILCLIVAHTWGFLTYTIGSLRASRTIHAQLMKSLMSCTFRWLDTTPTSRVIARCTQDIQAVDGDIALNLAQLISVTLTMLAKIFSVVYYTPRFFFAAVAIALIGGWLGNLYIKAQLSVKREMANAKAPVLGILGGAIAGLTSIRAYSAQNSFKKNMLFRVDRYIRASRTFYNLNRWIGIRIDALSAVFTSSLAFYLVYGSGAYTASSIGFILTMASSFSELILWWVRIYNDFEVSGNSLERIQQFIDIEEEPEPQGGGAPPAYWPASGKLEVEKLTARYSPEGPKVLQDVSFRIEAGERVGIVGRTGSGKSTLTLALLRAINVEGKIIYDGIPTETINLDALRSNMTIIPQVPELLGGTLRHNLDVFGQFDDATLNDALRAAGLFSLQRLSDENRMTLDTEIASGGGNLSVGQRQIIALARAIVRQSKLLILDEATSAIDYETDSVIQESLRHELKDDVTVITVAHRLQTIMDSDKVMVLDAGRLIEFDSPKKLLSRESLLRSLVDESADKEALYEMAKAKVTRSDPPSKPSETMVAT